MPNLGGLHSEINPLNLPVFKGSGASPGNKAQGLCPGCPQQCPHRLPSSAVQVHCVRTVAPQRAGCLESHGEWRVTHQGPWIRVRSETVGDASAPRVAAVQQNFTKNLAALPFAITILFEDKPEENRSVILNHFW